MKTSQIFIILSLFACTANTKQPQETDTLEVLPADSAITDEVLENEPISSVPEFYDSTYQINSSLAMQELTILDEDDIVTYSLLNTLYEPYYYRVGNAESESDPAFVITSVNAFNLTLMNKAGACEDMCTILTYRDNPTTGEGYFDIHFLAKKDNEITPVHKLTFDGDYAQSSSKTEIVSTYKLSNACQVLAIRHSSEGGDIDLSRNSLLTFYVLDQYIPVEILSVKLEDTTVSNFFETNDETKDAVSEISTIDILPTTSNQLYDIKVMYTQKTDGKITDQQEIIYKYNGSKYTTAR